MTQSDPRYNWILSTASDDQSAVYRLVCAETGVEYILTIVEGEIRSLEVDKKEIINNADVAMQLWSQLATVVSFAPKIGFDLSNRMRRALVKEESSDG